MNEPIVSNKHVLHCLLFRHGIAVESEKWTGKESERPLTEKGIRRVRRAGDGLKRLQIRPTVVMTSVFKRAADTAKILQSTLSVEAPVHFAPELLPDAAPEHIVRALHHIQPGSCVICVGHEPHLGMTASWLLFGRASAAFVLKKAGACLIEMSLPAKPGHGRLLWWLTPRQLRSVGRGKAVTDD
ncbi:MAG TPA: phosphoglycerate mutase family protein [Nitrospiraceae bacterium]